MNPEMQKTVKGAKTSKQHCTSNNVNLLACERCHYDSCFWPVTL